MNLEQGAVNLEQAYVFRGKESRQESCSQSRQDRAAPEFLLRNENDKIASYEEHMVKGISVSLGLSLKIETYTTWIIHRTCIFHQAQHITYLICSSLSLCGRKPVERATENE